MRGFFGIKVWSIILVSWDLRFHLHISCLRFAYAFSSASYHQYESSPSTSSTQISHIFSKSKPVVIILVPMIISADCSSVSASFFELIFFILSESNRYIEFWGYRFLIRSSICWVPIPIDFSFVPEHLEHARGILYLWLQRWQSSTWGLWCTVRDISQLGHS